MLERLWNLVRSRRLDRELETELRYHLELLEAEHRSRGLSAEAARLAARRDFGALSRTREAYRDQRGLPSLETLARDVRLSLRSMARTPVVTLAVLATLAIGIGANTAIFSVVNGVLIRPLPYPEADRLISISHTSPVLRIDDLGSAPFLYFTERDENRTLEGVGLWSTQAVNITGRGEPERVLALRVTADVLPLLGIQPRLGRVFTRTDDEPRSPRTAVLMHGYWQRRFGGDSSIAGQSITVDGQPYEIAGVMPQSFRFLDERTLDVIVPMQLDRAQVTTGGYGFRSLGRMKPTVTLERATADVARLIPIALDSFPVTPGYTRQQMTAARFGPVLTPLKQIVVGDAGNTLWVVMGTLGLVLLIACANVANLILVRTEGRQRELAVQAALGAGRGRIARALLTESAVLGLVGGALGVGAAYLSLRVLLAIGSSGLPRMDEIAMDSAVILFALAISLLAGLLFGLLPVLRYTRPALSETLRGEGRSSTGTAERHRARSVLVVVQIALALVLIVSAGLMIQTFRELNTVEPGFEGPDEIQSVRITIPEATESDPETAVRRQQTILDGLAALPGVTSVAYTSQLPMDFGLGSWDLLVPEGRTRASSDRPALRSFHFISPGYFAAMGIPIRAGRDLTWTEIYDRRTVVLVSETLAREEWGSPVEALGKRLRGGSAQGAWREVVGVVGDVRNRGAGEPVGGIVYLPVLLNQPDQVVRSVAYVIRSGRTGTSGFLSEIQRAVWAVNPDLPLANVRSMGEFYGDSLARTSFTLVMLATAGTMALLLGVIGIYAVMSYIVSQRALEVGIRMALGAQRQQIRSMFMRQGLALTAVGVLIGLGGAVALARWMSTLLFGVSPLDPFTYTAGAAALTAAAALASYLPSRRATRVDPHAMLRTQ
jgi:predicted permease